MTTISTYQNSTVNYPYMLAIKHYPGNGDYQIDPPYAAYNSIKGIQSQNRTVSE